MTNEKVAAGLYFNLDSFLVDGDGERTKISPIELLPSDEAVIVATLYSYADDRPFTAPKIAYSWKSDDGKSGSGFVKNASCVEFGVSSDAAGSLNFRVFALDGCDKEIEGSESAYGGLIFGLDDISPKSCAPKDLYSFWDTEIDRLFSVTPTDTRADGYPVLQTRILSCTALR